MAPVGQPARLRSLIAGPAEKIGLLGVRGERSKALTCALFMGIVH